MQIAFGVITLYVRNMPRTLAFFTDVLELEVVEELIRGTFVILKPARGPLITLQYDAEMFGPVAKPQGYEVGIIVPDLDALYARWQAALATVLLPPHDLPLGRTFVGVDPDGHRIRCYELKPDLDFDGDEPVQRALAALRAALGNAP